jgi:CO dehydrogenase maturation factor
MRDEGNTMKKKNVIAVCGKGGVGKTVTSGALVRTLAEMGQRVLAIDADPAMGLSFILGLPTDIKTIGSVRRDLVDKARSKQDPQAVADSTDYLVLETLIETRHFSFMAMGRSMTRGCFCPLNTLLKGSVKKLADHYDWVVVDAEAGLEQINREVMAGVSHIVTLIDGSQRSMHSLELICQISSQMKMAARIGAVLNRRREKAPSAVLDRVTAAGLPLWGMIPEDETLRNNDTLGKPIFDLAPDSPVLESTRRIAHELIQD